MINKTQQKALQFIRHYLAKYHYSPTAAEIASGIGIKSRGTIYRHLKKLSNEGIIDLIPRRHRNIQLVK